MIFVLDQDEWVILIRFVGMKINLIQEFTFSQSWLYTSHIMQNPKVMHHELSYHVSIPGFSTMCSAGFKIVPC